MKRRIAFKFDEVTARALLGMLDKKQDDYVTVTIPHPVTGEDCEIVLPNIGFDDQEFTDELAQEVESLSVTLVGFENDLTYIKGLVDEMIRADDCGLAQQIEVDIRALLERMAQQRASEDAKVKETLGEPGEGPALSARAAVSVAIQSWRKQQNVPQLDDRDLQAYVSGTLRHPRIAPLVNAKADQASIYNEVISLLNGIIGR